MVLYKCDLCDQVGECVRKVIDGREYDICHDCWNPLEQKLKGKGKPNDRETVYIPAPERREPEKEKPSPGEPPTIWCDVRPAGVQ
jgi:ribosome-binding protein aMBF1 (putative translation factor)